MNAANDSLRVIGIGRVRDDPKALELNLTGRPSDDDMRRIHDLLRDGRATNDDALWGMLVRQAHERLGIGPDPGESPFDYLQRALQRIRPYGVPASEYLAKVEADPRRAAALQRARDRAPGVMVDAAPQPTPYGLAGIDGDAIVIRLTADACAFAFANDPQAREPRPPVINKQQFLRDTLNELTAEREDGSTPLTDMLDRAMVKAMENGSDALDHDAAGVATDGGDDADH